MTGGNDTPPYFHTLKPEGYCRGEGIFHRKQKNEIFGFEK